MVTVREQLATNGPHFSVEFFPPRTDDEESTLWTTIRALEARSPAFVSVTYGAGGSHRDRTVRVTEQIAARTTLLPVAHLTAVGHTLAELRQIIGAYAAAGVHNILALRGDPPGSDPLAPWIAQDGGLAHADELVRLTRSLGEFCVGVAAYPTKHPQSPDTQTDTFHLAGKVSAGADYVITQMLFSASDYAALVDRARVAGVTVPIIPGIMPVTSSVRLARICQLSGQPVPAELSAQLAHVADDPVAARAVGMQHALHMCRDLLDMGAPSLHFYTFNRSTLTLKLLDELGIGASTSARRTHVRQERTVLA
ncbi:MAG: methylenetetrahydrofolate reductase [NAD(P)H] [Nakamurella sp.]